MESLFVAVNLAVLPFWVLMIFAPCASLSRRVMASPLSIAWMPVVYAGLILPRLRDLLPLFTSPPALEPIAKLLGSPEGATIGWIHFLAFDLFVGRWVYLDARSRGVRWWVSSPVLFLVLMVGPLGLLVYLLFRGPDEVRPIIDQERLRSSDGASPTQLLQ